MMGEPRRHNKSKMHKHLFWYVYVRLAAVSLERLPDDYGHPWALQPTGTYAHTAAYLADAAAAAGLRLEHHDTEHSPRLEAGVPVLGQLAVLSRASG